MLNPEKAHYPEFSEAGYTLTDGELIFHELELQFDEAKGVKHISYPDGAIEFVIYMLLGKTKKRTFKTVWRKDDVSPLPRFITAYRDKEGEKYVQGI